MDARLLRLAALVPALLLLAASSSLAANYSYATPNFVVSAPSADFAKQVGDTAERFRAQLAREWLGHELPKWYRPCQVTITSVGQVGAGGATTFTFAGGQVFGWNMRVQGTPERILDSVIPHEVSHTIFASHFRRPLPRWADEGAASLVEHESERNRQLLLLRQVFNTPRRIPLTQLISMKEYPSDMQSVLTLYAEGYSLADYLVQSGGRERYLNFLQDANDRDWNHAIRTYYGLQDVVSLERRWNDWVLAGSPGLTAPAGQMIAQADRRGRPAIVRSQSPDEGAEPVRSNMQTAAASARPVPRNDLNAPSPIDRRALSVRGEQQRAAAENADEAFEPARARALRREGRERMVEAGWQPAAHNAANAAPQDDISNESPARRRIRTVKERHVAEEARTADASDAIEEGPRSISERDLQNAESPFHVEK